jgi:CRISPR type III-B/RAMP module-associated protein Cmr3
VSGALDAPLEVIGNDTLADYLRSPHFSTRLWPLSSPATTDRRSGIARSPAGVVRTGYLYQAEFVRPSMVEWATTAPGVAGGRVTIVAEVPDPDGGQPGDEWRLPLGGEHRAARARWLPDLAASPYRGLADLLDPNGAPAQLIAAQIDDSDGWLRVVLLQPAIFDRGWLPDAVTYDPAARQYVVGGLPFALRSAAFEKPVVVSGWDLGQNLPKPLAYAMRAGSVYLFQHLGPSEARPADVQAFIQRFHGWGAPSTGGPGALQSDVGVRRSGYGLSAVGACQPVVHR